jgi:hypothetical protein
MPVFLVNEEGERFQIGEGVTVLGRGETLGITNKKCSRRQAELEVMPNNLVYLTAVCTHLEPGERGRVKLCSVSSMCRRLGTVRTTYTVVLGSALGAVQSNF